MKKGFTLVELSIAIVVVGLLIGGLLVGQSLIESAKVNKFIRQMSSYDVAISTFQSKYKSLPGDSTLFSPSGDNNGWIRQGAGNSGDGSFQGEIAAVWKHLSNSQMIKETYSNATSETPGVDLPIPVLGDNKAGIYVVTAASVSYGMYVVGQHYFFICESGGAAAGICTGTWDGIGTGTVFSTSRALAIENKLDDGNSLTGNIKAASSLGYYPTAGASGCIKTHWSTGIYNLDSTATSPCNLSIKVFSTR